MVRTLLRRESRVKRWLRTRKKVEHRGKEDEKMGDKQGTSGEEEESEKEKDGRRRNRRNRERKGDRLF